MMLAAPGQLAAVSALARDPAISMMAEEAQTYPVVHGSAEEVFLLDADLVVAGAMTARASVAMLRRLGVPVLDLDLATSFEDIRNNLRTLGAALGREERAEALITEFDEILAAARRDGGSKPPRAALQDSNNYTSGGGTLVNEIVSAAGLSNIAAERGLIGMARLPLEALVMAAPDILIGGRRYDAPALANQTFQHPAARAMARASSEAQLTGAQSVCGTPYSARAVEALAEARDALADD